jgi:hypothetical protein
VAGLNGYGDGVMAHAAVSLIWKLLRFRKIPTTVTKMVLQLDCKPADLAASALVWDWQYRAVSQGV